MGDQPDELPQNCDIVTPERIAKGDLELQTNTAGHIRYAQVQTRTLLNFLWESRILDDQHVHDAQTYEIWQICFSAFLGYRNSPVYRGDLSELRNALANAGLETGDFEKLIRALRLTDKRLIEYAIYTTATEHTRWFARRDAKHYRDAFDRLTEQMERLRDAAEDRRKAQEQGPGFHDDVR